MNFWKTIKNNTYLLQIITLMSGTLLAQIVMLGFIPILTRLYSPAEFGIYSLFFSITSILGMVSSWKYDQAIMLPSSNKDANALLFLSIGITIGMTLLVTIAVTLFYDFWIGYFQELSFMLPLIPLSVLIIGLLQIFTAHSSRNQFYKKLASVQVANALGTVSVQSIGRYFLNLDGLIVGKMIGDTIALSLLIVSHIKKQTLHLKSLSKRRIRVNAKRYDNFPRYQSFNVFLNALSQNVPILMFVSLFSPEIAGFYALTVRVLQAPISLVGSSTREVYYQKASKMYANGESIYNLYKTTTLGLLKLFVIPFFLILLLGEQMFSLIFGDQWGVSGIIAQISIVWFLFTFINPPSIMSYNILGLQKFQLKLQVGLLGLRVLSIYAGFYFFESYIASIILFTITGVLMNIISILYIRNKIKCC